MYNGTDAFGVRSQPSANPATESSTSDHAENFSYKGTAGNKRSGSESADVSSSHEPDVDPELARYLNRDYWQRRKNEQKNAVSRRFSQRNCRFLIVR
ncbi:unnamed protein product [Anisakis simplex]|uniref:SORBS2 n=1 Tax=Anisakis simplex TaxID=6269 RepID=A0A0M3JKG4_ANISI|nr:unnamed protein product [Anisakis simplex]